MDNKELKAGMKVLYRYNSRGKWQNGKIWKIDKSERFKRTIAVKKYINGAVINWPEVLKMCDGRKGGDMIKRNVPGWYFQYWVTPENVKVSNPQ